jgi:hypothetical protein
MSEASEMLSADNGLLYGQLRTLSLFSP